MSLKKSFAIIGIGCRFPGGINSLDKLWETLSQGMDVVSQVPNERFDIKRYWHPDRQAPSSTCTVSAGIVDNIKMFDPGFWGMSPKEAEMLDPQQRMVLEMTWEAFEDAGISPSSMAGSKTAVYIGAASTDMGMAHADDLALMGPYSMTGTSLSIIANRVSYMFDLHGPSMTIDTACSSSLVALNEACKAIERDNLPMAIVGGVNVLLSPMPFIGFSKAHMLSDKGRCQVFDKNGNGYVRSEGGSVILIKPLERALADHDPIHAVIEAVGVNSDGRTNGIALPNGEAQKALLKSIYEQEEINPQDVVYVEAHGTGTAVGDPIEANSIGSVLGRLEDPLWIGSVKSQVGHLETGSGMAGLAKCLLVLDKQKIPANLHFNSPNPAIDFKNLGLRVPQTLTELPQRDGKSFIGLNSFGFGGTNAHVVLSGIKNPSIQKNISLQETDTELLPFVISAKSQESLMALAKSYALRLEGKGVAEFNQTASAAATQRQWLTHRLLITAKSVPEAVGELDYFAQLGEVHGGSLSCLYKANGQSTKTALVFSGNGCQWVNMGSELYRQNSLFAQTIDEIDEYFYPLSGWRVGEYLLKEAEDWQLEKTEYAQPLLFALQVAMTTCLKAKGVCFDATVGHSVGEVAASWAAGILSLAQAVEVIYVRSSLQATLQGCGGMAAVKTDSEVLEQLMEQFPSIEIAGVNAPGNFTVSGDVNVLDQLSKAVKSKKGGLYKRLPIDYAFHSSRMASLEKPLHDQLGELCSHKAIASFYSTVSGKKWEDGDLDRNYWWKNVRQPVLFESAISELLKDGVTRFVEVGPHAILSGYIRQIAKALKIDVQLLHLMSRGEGIEKFEHAWRTVFVSGNVPSGIWSEVSRDRTLPRYPWNKKRCWVKPTSESWHIFGHQDSHPLLGWSVPHAKWVWENTLDTQKYSWLKGHEIDETVLFPAAAFLELAQKAARAMGMKGRAIEIDHFQILRPLPLQETPSVMLRTTVSDQGVLTIASRTRLSEEDWLVHATARLTPSDAPKEDRLNLIQDAQLRPLDVTALYDLTTQLGLNYQGAFRGVEKAWGDDCSVRVQLQTKDPSADEEMGLSPALVDGALQGLFFILRQNGAAASAYLPTWFGQCTIWKEALPRYGVVNLIRASDYSAVANFTLYDQHGDPIARLNDVRFRRVRHGHRSQTASLYVENWVSLSQKRKKSYLADHAFQLLNSKLSQKTTLSVYDERTRSLFDLLAVCYVWRAVVSYDQWVPLEFLFSESLTPEYENFSEYLANLLCEFGLAEEKDGLYKVSSQAELPSPEQIARTLLVQLPAYWPEILLGINVGEQLPNLLDGSLSADDVMQFKRSALWQQRRQTPLSVALRETVLSYLKEVKKSLSDEKTLRVCVLIHETTDVAHELYEALDGGAHLTLVSNDAVIFERLNQEFKGLTHLTMVKASEDLSDFTVAGLHDLIFVTEDLSYAHDVVSLLKLMKGSLYEGGQLLLLQPQPCVFENFIEGFRSDWWRKDNGILSGALMDAALWKECMVNGGFSEVEVLSETQTYPYSFFVGRQASEVKALPATDQVSSLGVLFDEQSSEQKALALKLSQKMRERGIDVIFSPVDSTQSVRWVSLLEVDESHCQQPPLKTLELCQTLLKQTDDLEVIYLAVNESSPKTKALQGLVRVFQNECAWVKPGFMVLDELNDAVVDLAVELLASKELLFDEGWVLADDIRVVEVKQEYLPAEKKISPVKLEFDAPGKLERLKWVPFDLSPLGNDEVRIEVKATGLNFRDVMWTMGMLPEEALENGFSGPTLGLECSGVVLDVGRDVTNVSVGEEVVGFAPACFSSVVTTKAMAVYPKPHTLTFNEAASIPVAFFTAWYAMVYLGRARKAERILIHGAAGGVGLAAIQIAQLLGLEVFATAGSPSKRRLIKSLGVSHIYDSRNLAFADQIKNDTQGKGVDLVLNSLAGQGAEKSLSVLAPFGRFLELGKRDFYEDNPLFLRPFRRNLSYFGIDVDQMLVDVPQLAQDLFAEVLAHFEKGHLRALPLQVFTQRSVVEAFQAMQSSLHIGKLVVSYDSSEVFRALNDRLLELDIRQEATYVISGGLGGLGLAIAEALANRGAKSLCLLSRRGVSNDHQKNIIAALQQKGVEVLTPKVDLASETLSQVLDETLGTQRIIAGVIHAAGELRDAIITNQTAESFTTVWNTKVVGAMALDNYARSHDWALDFFIFFSSATTLLGNPGQSNYVAANMALEAVAYRRKVDGLAATVIGWGPVGDVGMLQNNEHARLSLEKTLGTKPLMSQEVVGAMQALAQGRIFASHYLNIDWQRIRKMPGSQARRFQLLWQGMEQGVGEQISLASTLEGKTEEEAIDFLVHHVTEAVAKIMGLAPTELNPMQSIADIGMDSLMVVELAVVLEERLGVKMPAVSLSGGASIRTIAERFYQTFRHQSEEDQMLDVLLAQHGVNASDVKSDIIKEIGKES